SLYEHLSGAGKVAVGAHPGASGFIDDAYRAEVRSYAAWDCDPHAIGIMGCLLDAACIPAVAAMARCTCQRVFASW
ncbi:hypothetical protein QT768_21450, partial [Xanthomonas citri pv. citri]